MTSPPTSPPQAAVRPVESVGFIGLGHMGGGMARRIIDAGWRTVLWARRPEVLDSFAGDEVEFAGTPADLAAASDVVGVCVWADEDVRQVVAGEHGLLSGCRPGTVIAIHATVLPGTCRDLARLAAEQDVAVLDAPVSGGRDVALAGALTVAVGGTEEATARARPVFEAFAGTITRVGGVGAGQLAKLVNNALLAANIAVADDALTLGRDLGIDTDALTAFLREGSGRSYGLDVALRARTSAATREVARPALEKDLQLLGAEAGGDDALLRLAAEAVRRLQSPPDGWAAEEEPS